MENKKNTIKKNILEKALYDGPIKNLRPLYGSNMAKKLI